MNTDNFLVIQNSISVKSPLFQIALFWAEQGYDVLYIVKNPMKELPSESNQTLQKDVLKRIIFMYISTYELLLQKLLGLHNWIITPRIIIIDSIHDIVDCNAMSTEIAHEKFALLIASLFSCVRSLSDKTNQKISSIISIDPGSSLMDQIFKNLIHIYYYKEGSVIQSNNIFVELLKVLGC